ncbi:hypothetical protein [Pseudoxanthomonas sp. PXM01]|uniref:hypothetical protein n=1 Tax=Pseudoxanthomonas sp. PXM01 TaxID=2769295 RepID=UPI00177A9DED|nr:hypothetical protein [Pseudoxanthomonas sp. PXM01]MBD9469839.1 hypothetical protein [Pseudoxanthomonas sp. PXM01]
MSRTVQRLSFALLSCLLVVALAGCAAPASSDGTAGDLPPASTPSPKPTGGNQPPREAGAVTVDYACKTSADCAVKNVGNCCGAMPACVNKNSPTDPQGVQAQCAASGRMGICGFADVTACQCVSGRCESDSSVAKLPAQ